MKKVTVISLLGLGALGLVGCSAHVGGHIGQNSGSGGASSTKTYALPGQPGYRGNTYAYYKNPLRSPANQTYYFAFDSSKMRPKDLAALKAQARYLAAHPNAKIRLEGNTDNRGSREYNVGLGWRRDQSVTRLLEQQGVRPAQIQMVSYGKERPVLEENNEKAWSLNRRVNLVYKRTS